MKGLFGACFSLLFLLLQGGYSEEQKYGYFKIDFKNESPPRFVHADPIVFEKKGCWEKNKDTCKLMLELCFIGRNRNQWDYESFDTCEKADSTLISYTLIVRKVGNEIKTDECTPNRAGPIKSLRKHAKGNEIHVFAKVFFPIGDPVYMDESSYYQNLEGNLEADHPYHFSSSFHKHLDRNKSREELWYTERTLLWVRGTLQLMCEENWYGCWCDQFCYADDAFHYDCDNKGNEVCKMGFFPERGDLELCRQKDPSISRCQNYCSFEDREKLKEREKSESCDACGYKTCNDYNAYYLDQKANSCEKRTCTVPIRIFCLANRGWGKSVACENLSDADAKTDEGTGAYFKCKCEGDKKTKKFNFAPRWYYCED